MRNAKFRIIFAVLCTTACTSPQLKNTDMNANDPYLWLEEVESEKSLSWVRERNRQTVTALEARPDYKEVESNVRKVLLAKDRIPSITYRGGYVYNFWQDEKRVRGIWRRMPLSAFQKHADKWETLIDLDALAISEKENWVWEQATCLPTTDVRCLVSLSRGGTDAVVVREFDIAKKSWVENGFVLPEAKSSVAWFDADTLAVSTDFGPGSMSKSGYPRQVRMWKRGQPLAHAQVLLVSAENDMATHGWASFSPTGVHRIVSRMITFWESHNHLVNDDLSLTRIPFPDNAETLGIHSGYIYAKLRTDWKTSRHSFRAGSLVALDLNDLSAPPTQILGIQDRTSIDSTIETRDAIYVRLVDNVKGRIVRITRENNGWTVRPTSFPSDGDLELTAGDSFDNVLFATYESFLNPPSLLMSDKDARIREVRALPPRFRATDLIQEQLEAISADGTRVPYFVVRRKNIPLDGSTPTVLYGYGGFEVSLTPFYLGATGKVWVENGGAWVVANLRGGGEFGPSWHQAALKENRQKAFDDFIAIGEDLIRRKITSPSKLAIMGGSNGGLLVGATFTQRPDLFRAVVCQVPLLDMLRYHKLLAGHSWMAEYGDPDDPQMASIIRRYSPYQNLSREKKYPSVFFLTSTKDDRVHPGHARKMAARMKELGHDIEYFENIEGGHGAAANLEQRIRFQALTFAFLRRELELK